LTPENHDDNSKATCDVCHFAKHRKLPFYESCNKAEKPFELIHFDIWGPTLNSSIHKHSYFLTAVDDYNRYTWITLMKSKSEARQHLINFITLIEKQHDCHVKIVRTNNGPEFTIPQFYASKGILHQTSCVEIPQQNARVERKHQHILNITRALLFQSNLPKTFWSYAAIHAVFIMNRVPSPILNNQTPDLHQLKVFGSLAYASTLQSQRIKLASRARKCIFLGYRSGMNGVILLNIHTKLLFDSINVTHHECIFPYKQNNSTIPWEYHTNVTYTSNTEISEPEYSSPIPEPESPSSVSENEPLSPVSESSNKQLSSSPDNSSPSVPIIHKSTRIKSAPGYLKDYICHNSSASSPKSVNSGISYPITSFHSFDHLSPLHKVFSISVTQSTESNTYKEACQSEHWLTAMNVELKALADNGTWSIVDLPPNVKPIGSKWVYKVKHKADGTIERYKARLVAKGYNQIEGLDFFDTFSPVAKLTTVRTLLAVASVQNWHLHQLDVNNVFLHGDLQEDVFMSIPEGVHSFPGKVCKLKKSLYGLKQASRKWYEKLTALLLSEGYSQSGSDYSLFTLQQHHDFTAILVYVDDIILAGTSLNEFQRIKSILDVKFKIKDLGILKYFLGLEVSHSKTSISISRRKYCLDLLASSGLLGSKPASTPLDTSIKLHQDTSKPFEYVSCYRRLIGRLLYLNTTRPDISLATQQLSQFLNAPIVTHYKAACRILRYLKNNPGLGLLFPKTSETHILGYVDADWAGSMDTRRSTTGFCFFLGSSLISWRANKQATVSRISSEAEYKALSTATCELQWLLYLLKDLNIKCSKQPALYCDSQSAIHIASNLVFHERTKHLEIDCHFVREKIQKRTLRLLPISTHEQLVDFLTKPLAPPKFSSFISRLGMINIYHGQCNALVLF